MLDEQIRQAIAGRNIVACRYNGQRRIGEPHVYGVVNGEDQAAVLPDGRERPVWAVPGLAAFRRGRHHPLDGHRWTFSQVRVGSDNSLGEWDEVLAIVAD